MTKQKHPSMQLMPGTVEYAISLSDGSTWRVLGLQPFVRWVHRLAAIMELDETAMRGSPRLVFCGSGHTDEALGGTTDSVSSKSVRGGSEDGWSCIDYNTLRIWSHSDIGDVVCELKDDDDPEIEFLNMWMALQPIYRQSISRGGLPFHAGLAEREGHGILLVASGDQGKTTCCNRLSDHWRALCDDETLVVIDREGRYRTHPFPTWSDYMLGRSLKTWNVHYSVPLLGVFFLEQAEIDEAVALGEGQTAILLNESAGQICKKFWQQMGGEDQKKFRQLTFDNACDIAKKIPAYRLRVSLHGRFWEKIEQVLGL